MMMMMIMIMMMMMIMIMMMMMIMIIIIIIIMMMMMMIIIAFKGEFPHCAANRLQQVCSSSPGPIVFKSRATHRALITCSIPYYVVISLTELKSHLFELYFIG